MLFNIIPDSFVILRSKGVYKQVKTFERNGFIYAQHGNGFIRLMKSGTSVPHVSIDCTEMLNFEHKYTAMGYMVKADHPDAK